MSQQPPLTVRDQLKQSCRFLANASPDQWRDFLGAFDRYKLSLMEGVAMADAAEIMTAKGAALNAKVLLQLFQECNRSTP